MNVSSLNGPDPTMREHSLTSCTVLHFWVEPVLGLAGDDDADTVRVGALEGAGALVAVPPAGAREGMRIRIRTETETETGTGTKRGMVRVRR